MSEYIAILRCQTWNVWPERTVIEHCPFIIEYGGPSPVTARLAILSYLNRTSPEVFQQETTTLGPLVWDGTVKALYLVRDTVLKAPEDTVELAFEYRHARRGEVDVCMNFKFSGELPSALLEAVRASASAIMSLVNLRLHDYLTPSVPIQIRKVLNGGGGSMASDVLLAVHHRATLAKETVEETLAGIAKRLVNAQHSDKLRVALELYAAHFVERQVRVRFLLLVMAMESLASATRKHQAAITLLERWQQELSAEMSACEPSSDEFQSLEALARELNFRTEDSIRSQVRKLFRALAGTTDAECAELERKALRVYDKRSILVHDGYLPHEELSTLEAEARELLEKLLLSAESQDQDELQTSHPSNGI